MRTTGWIMIQGAGTGAHRVRGTVKSNRTHGGDGSEFGTGALRLVVEYNAPSRGNNRSHRVGRLVKTDEIKILLNEPVGPKFG